MADCSRSQSLAVENSWHALVGESAGNFLAVVFSRLCSVFSRNQQVYSAKHVGAALILPVVPQRWYHDAEFRKHRALLLAHFLDGLPHCFVSRN
jgi:hypothetical protein